MLLQIETRAQTLNYARLGDLHFISISLGTTVSYLYSYISYHHYLPPSLLVLVMIWQQAIANKFICKLKNRLPSQTLAVCVCCQQVYDPSISPPGCQCMQVNDNVSRLTTGNLKRLATYEPDVYTYVDPSVRQSRGRAHACLHACLLCASFSCSLCIWSQHAYIWHCQIYSMHFSWGSKPVACSWLLAVEAISLC